LILPAALLIGAGLWLVLAVKTKGERTAEEGGAAVSH
jgi:hypothetical protein